MLRLLVDYKRDLADGDGYQSFEGVVRVYYADELKAEHSAGFKKLDFPSMIRNLHLTAKQVGEEFRVGAEDTAIVFRRMDRPELDPFTMDAATRDLIVHDPEKAIEAMSVPDVRVVVGRPQKPLSNLRVGAETMANAFGEKVALRRLRGLAECPGCGKWRPVKLNIDEHYALHCECFPNMPLPVERVDDQWLLTKVEHLLATDLPRFFLPREWNSFEPWIHREKLEELLTQFNKESADVR